MDERAIRGELEDIIVKRLKFEPKRLAGVTLDTPLAKGVEGSLGLDSLDFIELSIALEERFGVVVQEGEDVVQDFATLGSLVRFIRTARGEAGSIQVTKMPCPAARFTLPLVARPMLAGWLLMPTCATGGAPIPQPTLKT